MIFDEYIYYTVMNVVDNNERMVTECLTLDRAREVVNEEKLDEYRIYKDSREFVMGCVREDVA